MDIVMFHTGGELPKFLEYTFRQIRLFNPDVAVYFLTDTDLVHDPLFDKYNILPFNKGFFYSDKIGLYESLFNYPAGDFWTVTATRFMYIENLIERFDLNDVYHFENDVLLYYDLSDHHDTFKKLYKNMAITVGGEIVAMTGFMFIKHYVSLAKMTQYFIDMLHLGVQGLINKYNIPMVNEMFFLRKFCNDYPDLLSHLPTMPFGEFSENYSEFNSLFDPASYGQYVGGTQSEGPGAKPQDHYIGRWMAKNTDIDVIWKDNVPYLQYANHEIKINNLHIHSKNLHKYMS